MVAIYLTVHIEAVEPVQRRFTKRLSSVASTNCHIRNG